LLAPDGAPPDAAGPEPPLPELLVEVVEPLPLRVGAEGRWPLLPSLPPPEGPPAIDPPVAVPAASAKPVVPARAMARATVLVASNRLLNRMRLRLVRVALRFIHMSSCLSCLHLARLMAGCFT